MVVDARSRSPLGPWENSPFNPIVHTASPDEKWWSRGHGTVFEAATGQWWMVYHAYERDNRPLGRQTLLEPVEWTAEGWARVPQSVDPAQPMAAPNLPAAPLPPLERSDRFAGSELGMQWQFWGEYDPGRFSFRDRALVLTGKGKSLADCGPLACMAGHASYRVEVDVELEGEAQAGLILFYNPAFYAGLGISADALWAGERGQLRKTKYPNPDRRMLLRIVCDHNDVDFLAGPDAGSLEKVYQSINVSGYTHHTLGGFLSLRPALYCAGKGRAVFRNFRYTPLGKAE
jgi:xylan 1,4-beta-xylosidase